MSSPSHDSPPHGKVAIARLIAPKSSSLEAAQGTFSHADRARTGLACVNCRRRKVKCSGDLPKCEYCTKLNIICKYPPPRRDKLHLANSHLEEALALLGDLRLRQSPQDQERIQALLDVNHAEEEVLPKSSPSSKRLKQTPLADEPKSVEKPDGKCGESRITADAGSNQSRDVLEEDLIRDAKSRATGFSGKASVIQWIRRLKLQIDLDSKGITGHIPLTYGPPGDDNESYTARIAAGRLRRSTYVDEAQESISQSTYFMDDEPVDIPAGDPFYLPPPQLAKHLFICYMDTVHESFAILSKNEIELDFDSVFGREAKQDRNSLNMLAILNLIFAIGAKFSYLAYGNLHVGDQDHLMYSNNARQLGITENAFTSHPDLGRIRILGLLSFYLLSIGQISRASNIMGFVVRLAFTLGLHVQNEDPVADVRMKEARVRVWWSLYTLERLICTISGRPSVIADEECSIFLPVPLEENQAEDDEGMTLLQEWFDGYSIGSPNPTLMLTSSPKSAFFRAMTQVSIITHKAVRELYSAATATNSWEDTQNTMKRLKNELGRWAKSLPPTFTTDPFKVGPEFQRQTRILTLMYWGAFMLITRPCVCRLDIRIEDQTEESDRFNQYAASLCIHAAKQISNLFPKQIDGTLPYKIGPWWSVVHSMMQAITIFLLELYHRTHHVPSVGEKQDLLQHFQKLVKWLKAMGKNDPLAYRAYRLVIAVIQTLAPQVDMTIAEMLGVDEEEEAADATEILFQDMMTDAGSMENFFPGTASNLPSDMQDYMASDFEPPLSNVPFELSTFGSSPYSMSGLLFEEQAQFMGGSQHVQPNIGRNYAGLAGGEGSGSNTVAEGAQGSPNGLSHMFVDPTQNLPPGSASERSSGDFKGYSGFSSQGNN